MKYYLDTEFHEYKKEVNDHNSKEMFVDTIELISIGIVCEDGREFYRISRDFDLEDALKNTWLKENVIEQIVFENVGTVGSYWQMQSVFNNYGIANSFIKDEIVKFIGDDENPQFYGYFCDYDWVVFCWLFGRMIDLPKAFPMYCIDLKQIADTYSITKEWIKENLPSSNEHNALADALWNKQLHEAIIEQLLSQ